MQENEMNMMGDYNDVIQSDLMDLGGGDASQQSQQIDSNSKPQINALDDLLGVSGSDPKPPDGMSNDLL